MFSIAVHPHHSTVFLFLFRLKTNVSTYEYVRERVQKLEISIGFHLLLLFTFFPRGGQSLSENVELAA